MGGGIIIRGPLDSVPFRRAIEFAFRQHDVERLKICADGGEPRQVFLEKAEYGCAAMDFSGQTEPFQSAIEWLLADIARPMREDQFPLCGDVLFRLGDNLQLWYPEVPPHRE